MSGVRLLRRFAALVPALLAMAAGGPALAATSPYPQSMLDGVGPVAELQKENFAFDMIVITLIWAAVIAYLLYVVIRFRRRPGDTDPADQIEGNPRMEVGWLLASATVLALLLTEGIMSERALAVNRAPAGESMRVQVIGHQWWWEFRYPDLGIVTANELHIPVGKVIKFDITSTDVIHSFWVPRIGGKTDAVPGRVNQMWLRADEPGTYFGQCAELCGASHARMLLRVIAHAPADFDAWVQARKNPTTAPRSDLAADGERIFGRVCLACHTIDGTPYQGKVGPNLTAFGTRATIGGGVLPNTPQNLARWILDPAPVKPGSKMPSYVKQGAIRAGDVEALVEYLEGLK